MCKVTKIKSPYRWRIFHDQDVGNVERFEGAEHVVFQLNPTSPLLKLLCFTEFLKAILYRLLAIEVMSYKQGQSEGGEDSGVDEGDGDVACAVSGGQAFVEVGQPPGVHEAPPLPG